MNKLRKTFAATVLAGGLAAGGMSIGGAASAQPLITGGLVNVTVTNLLNNNQVAVQIPVNAAADVCGLNVAVLAGDLLSGPVTCTSRSGNQSLSISQL